MYVISVTYISDLSEVKKHLQKHIDYLKTHYESGVFIASGLKVPRTGGVNLARGVNRNDLDAIITLDPFHREGVAKYEVTEFTPTMTAKGLESLTECE